MQQSEGCGEKTRETRLTRQIGADAVCFPLGPACVSLRVRVRVCVRARVQVEKSNGALLQKAKEDARLLEARELELQIFEKKVLQKNQRVQVSVSRRNGSQRFPTASVLGGCEEKKSSVMPCCNELWFRLQWWTEGRAVESACRTEAGV